MRVIRGESTRRGLLAGAVGAALIATAGLPGQAQAEGELNIYSSRHYDTDERLYSDFEQQRLDAACRGYILYLEQIGILSAPQREILIDRLLALDAPDIDVEQIKWVVLMVLFSQPGQELAYARMEDLVFDETTGLVH